MLEKIKNQQKILTIIFQTTLIYLIFWFLLGNLKTDGIWETVILNILFFGAFSIVFLKNKKTEKENLNFKQKGFLKLGIVGIWMFFVLFIFLLENTSFLKFNYLARVDWYLNDWWMLFVLNAFLVPVILFSQELFFRKLLFYQLNEIFTIKKVLFIQALIFVFFEVLFFEMFDWRFISFNLVLALLLGYFYYKTKNIWYSLMIRWGLILILEIYILNQIQNLKI